MDLDNASFKKILLRYPQYRDADRIIYSDLYDKSGINPYKYAPGARKEIIRSKAFSAKEAEELKSLERPRGEDTVSFDRIGHRLVPTR
ncbi:MAG: hypothetical protein ABH875_07580 [Candidatus Omnitrophota bacterium]